MTSALILKVANLLLSNSLFFSLLYAIIGANNTEQFWSGQKILRHLIDKGLIDRSDKVPY